MILLFFSKREKRHKFHCTTHDVRLVCCQRERRWLLHIKRVLENSSIPFNWIVYEIHVWHISCVNVMDNPQIHATLLKYDFRFLHLNRAEPNRTHLGCYLLWQFVQKRITNVSKQQKWQPSHSWNPLCCNFITSFKLWHFHK